MLRNPLNTTDITELMTAFTRYMVAAFVFLYYHFTFYASLIPIVRMKVDSAILFTVTFVKFQKAN